MKKVTKPILALAVIAIYLFLLLYVVPSQQPYFILGTAVVGVVAWLCGSVAGLATALILMPTTDLIYQQFAVSTSYMGYATSPAHIALQIIAAVGLGRLRREHNELARKESHLASGNELLQAKLADVKEVGGIHNLCSKCKSIQDEEGKWLPVDSYLKERTKMEFSHCICPDCAEQFHQSDASS